MSRPPRSADVGYRGVRTPMDTRAAMMVLNAVEAAVGASTNGVPIVNHDNNQHAPNENLRLQNLWDGIEVMGALFRMREPETATLPLSRPR